MYALIIQDELGNSIVEHVSVFTNSIVHVLDSSLTDDGGIPLVEWRKADHLIGWVRKNKPTWKIYEAGFGIQVKDGKISVGVE